MPRDRRRTIAAAASRRRRARRVECRRRGGGRGLRVRALRREGLGVPLLGEGFRPLGPGGCGARTCFASGPRRRAAAIVARPNARGRGWRGTRVRGTGRRRGIRRARIGRSRGAEWSGIGLLAGRGFADTIRACGLVARPGRGRRGRRGGRRGMASTGSRGSCLRRSLRLGGVRFRSLRGCGRRRGRLGVVWAELPVAAVGW